MFCDVIRVPKKTQDDHLALKKTRKENLRSTISTSGKDNGDVDDNAAVSPCLLTSAVGSSVSREVDEGAVMSMISPLI